MDIDGPPRKNFSKNYQSGPLSFEYSSDKDKIITNCGWAGPGSGQAMFK